MKRLRRFVLLGFVLMICSIVPDSMSCRSIDFIDCHQTAQVCVIDTLDRSRRYGTGGVWLLFTRCEHLVVGHVADHVIINQTFLVLKGIHKALLAYAIDHAWNAI